MLNLGFYIRYGFLSVGLLTFNIALANPQACPAELSSNETYSAETAKACSEGGKHFHAGWIYSRLGNCEETTKEYKADGSASAMSNLILAHFPPYGVCSSEVEDWKKSIKELSNEAIASNPYDVGLLQIRGVFEDKIYSYDAFRWYLRAYLATPYGEWETDRHELAESKISEAAGYRFTPTLAEELQKAPAIWSNAGEDSKAFVKNRILSTLGDSNDLTDIQYLKSRIDWTIGEEQYIRGHQHAKGHYAQHSPKLAYMNFVLSGENGVKLGADSARNLYGKLDKTEISEALCLASFNPSDDVGFFSAWYCKN